MFSRIVARTARVAVASSRGMATVTAAPKTTNALMTVGAVGVGALALGVSQAKSDGIVDTIKGYVGLGGSSGSSEWNAVAAELKELIEDDANLGPFMVRLAWHCSGSYNKADGSGGSNGATMRFNPEAGHGGNAGLDLMRDYLEPIKAAHPNVSYADLYTFAGKTAIEIMGGPSIPWKEGRADFAEGQGVTPDGRLPDAAQGAEHLRTVFTAYGFGDQGLVALSGAHCLGFCHDDRSGFVGPWTDEPYTFTNKYFTYMKDKKWQLKSWDGPAQFEDVDSQTLMMLPTDMALLVDTNFRKYVDLYAADDAAFRADFAKYFGALMENGVPRS